MTITHSFDVAVAQKTSVEQAILLNYFGYWHLRNRGNGHNYRNGKYWSYNKLEAFTGQFPYWSVKQIRTLLGHLKNAGYIVTENPEGQDRTTWYALTDKGCQLLSLEVDNESFAQTGKCILPNGQMDMPKRADAFAQTGTSICPNGQMIYKDTITEHTITEPLQNTLTSSSSARENVDDVGDEKKRQKPPPPLPPSPEKPPELPTKKIYGDGRLQQDCRDYHRNNPERYPASMYLAFLKYWTATIQKGKPEDIGQERWRTMDTWDVDDRLSRWHEKDKKQQVDKPLKPQAHERTTPSSSNHAGRYGSADYETAFSLVDALAAAGGLNGQYHDHTGQN